MNGKIYTCTVSFKVCDLSDLNEEIVVINLLSAYLRVYLTIVIEPEPLIKDNICRSQVTIDALYFYYTIRFKAMWGTIKSRYQ